MRGVKVTCPECTMDVRFILTWHDPIKERDGAASLFDAGAQVVFTGADTPAVADVATEKGKWGVTYDHPGSCKVDACLTAPYWTGVRSTLGSRSRSRPARTPRAMSTSTPTPRRWVCTGSWMARLPQPGVASLPAADVALVKDTLAKMLAGTFTRFDVFAGPIKDNTGKELLPAGGTLEQSDLDQFPPGAPGAECKVCMYWWNEGISSRAAQAVGRT